ncbi:phosphatase PAP2 family protein [Pararhodospirillum photometricum]|nr:phosphatase PAP2 family protein [Pararhodospirillum photometricum]
MPQSLAPRRLLLPVLAFCFLSMLIVDRPLALFLKARVGEGGLALGHALSVIGEAGWWYLLAGGLIAVGAVIAARTRVLAGLALVRNGFYLLAVLVTSGLLVTALKAMVGRARPRVLFHDGVYGFDPFVFSSNWNSFPSGHAQTICAAMGTLMVLYPRLRLPALALAVAVSLSRLMVTAHFLSDVVAGAFIGWTTVVVLRPFFKD